MTYKSMSLSVIIRSLFIALSGGIIIIGWSKPNYWILFLGISMLILLVFNFINYFNTINRKLVYFFDAIHNEDNTFSFSQNEKTKTTKQLHQSLNRVNNLIKDWKKRNEKNERFYLELIEHSGTGLIAFDKDGYTAVVNTIAKSYLGLHNKSNLILLKQRNSEIYNLFKSMQPGQNTTIRLLKQAEPIFLTITMSKLKFDENTYRIFALKNIKQELDKQEFDSWQKLIRVLTHEIMNSITPITSLSHTLLGFFKQNNIKLAPEQISRNTIDNTIEGLSVIEERGNGLIKFVDSYRAMTRFPEPNFKPIELSSFFGKLIQLSTALDCNKDCKFKTSIKGITHIVADEEMLMQAMINLIKNACEAFQKAAENCIEIKAFINSEKNPEILIIDNGEGISNEIQERMFVPFFTTKKNGSGIGLSICRQIMHLQNGVLEIKSEVGKGTIVSLVFK